MKALLKCAAVVLVSLLTMQPLLPGLHCITRMGHSSACPMGMPMMGPDCPMLHGDSLDCGTNCCPRESPAALLAFGKQQTLDLHGAVSMALEFALPPSAPNIRIHAEVPSHSPPLYIVHRVFRI